MSFGELSKGAGSCLDCGQPTTGTTDDGAYRCARCERPSPPTIRDADAVPAKRPFFSPSGPGEKVDKRSAATLLVEIAEETYCFGVSDGGESFAVPRQGPKVVALLRGG
ncbi:MAG TPA: hypothetical protein VK988_09770, partial [Acidimicrobiales bacterium]|nr:hypothetical protein [Acidimicrobiales bacterium]